jgi:hypothetical protein
MRACVSIQDNASLKGSVHYNSLPMNGYRRIAILNQWS